MVTAMGATIDRETWVKAALSALAGEGVEAVRVEPLARQLGVTKGSFYWHFANREALLTALLEHWQASATAQIIAELESTKLEASARLDLLVRRAFAPVGRVEKAIRAWAAHDKLALSVLRHVDRARVHYLTGMFAECGFAEDQAALRARTMYTCLLGEHQLAIEGSAERRVAHARATLALFLEGRALPG